MRLIPEVHVPIGHAGEAFGLGVAYLLFLLMFLTMITELFLVLRRALP